MLGAQVVAQRVQHGVEFGDIVGEDSLGVLVLDEFRGQRQARKRGAEVVADRLHGAGLVFQNAGDAALHLVEGEAEVAQVRRAFDGHWLGPASFADAMGGLGEVAQRLALLAQEVERHEQARRREQQGHDRKPQGQRPRGREIVGAEAQPAAVGQLHGADEVLGA